MDLTFQFTFLTQEHFHLTLGPLALSNIKKELYLLLLNDKTKTLHKDNITIKYRKNYIEIIDKNNTDFFYLIPYRKTYDFGDLFTEQKINPTKFFHLKMTKIPLKTNKSLYTETY